MNGRTRQATRAFSCFLGRLLFGGRRLSWHAWLRPTGVRGSWLAALAVLLAGSMLQTSCRVRVPGVAVDVDGESVLVDVPGVSVDVQPGRVQVDVPFFSVDVRQCGHGWCHD